MRLNNLLILCVGVFSWACTSQKIITAWKAETNPGVTRHNILVVAVVKDSQDSLRISLEDGLAKKLSELGYNAVSLSKAYGPGGLSNLGEANTYLKLCNDGIDAILTIALVDKTVMGNQPERYGKSRNLYYYNRIWNYRIIQADFSELETLFHTLFWAGILFDLSTLQPVCVIRTKSFKPGSTKELRPNLVDEILAKMRKEEVIVSHRGNIPARPF